MDVAAIQLLNQRENGRSIIICIHFLIWSRRVVVLKWTVKNCTKMQATLVKRYPSSETHGKTVGAREKSKRYWKNAAKAKWRWVS